VKESHESHSVSTMMIGGLDRSFCIFVYFLWGSYTCKPSFYYES